MHTMTPAQIGDDESRKDFAAKIFAEFKQKNKDEGISDIQALWLHHRTKAWSISYKGYNFTVDLMNMGLSGDIETACLTLMSGQPDDMTQPYHWMNQERINFLVTEMKAFLGWP